MVKMNVLPFLTCFCVLVNLTLGQDVDGFFLLAGATENTLYKLKDGSFLAIPVSKQIDTMAFDPVSRRVYFGSTFSINLYSMTLDGSDVRVEATTDLYVQAIAIDSAAGNIFVYSPGKTGKIYRIVMGQDPTLDQSDIIHQDELEVFHMTLDPRTRTLFWGSTTGVWQSNYDGTNKRLLSSTLTYAQGLTVDEKYVYGIANGKIFKIDRLLYLTYHRVFDIQDSSNAKSLVLVGTSLYYTTAVCVYNPTSWCNSSIATVQIDGTGSKRVGPVLSSNQGYQQSLVYVTRSNDVTTPPPISLTTPPATRSPVTAGNTVPLQEPDVVGKDSFLLSGAAERSIYKLKNNESYSIIPVSHAVTAQVYDYASNRIYYGVEFQMYVYSMRIDGSDVRTEAITDLYVQALAVDSMKNLLFVYSTNRGTIYRITLGQDWTMDQSHVIKSKQREVFHMTVDPKTSKLIWGSYTGLHQSDYDGFNWETLFVHTGYVDGVTFDDLSFYVLSENTVWKIDRLTMETYFPIFTQHMPQTRLSGLVSAGRHIYFGKYHCIYNTNSDCEIGIARVLKDGTSYQHVGPVLNTSFIQTPKLVHISSGKTAYAPDAQRHDGKKGVVSALVVVVVVVILLLAMVSAALFFLWRKGFFVGRFGTANPYKESFENPFYSAGAVGTKSGESNKAIYTVPNAESETHMYDQLSNAQNAKPDPFMYDQVDNAQIAKTDPHIYDQVDDAQNAQSETNVYYQIN